MEKASELEAVKSQLMACQEQKQQEEAKHKEELDVQQCSSVMLSQQVATLSTSRFYIM